jgi:hypothetical protein
MTASAARLKNDRLALLPAAAHADAVACLAALAEGGSGFAEFVLAQDLGALWHHTLQSAGLLDSLPPATKEALREARMAAAMGYLAQRAALDELDRLFDSAGIRWVAIKGSHVRELVYPDPALRPASDIDILIAPADRRRAAQALLDAGYSVHAEPANISHEATFSRGAVDIDLHWHMLRPGRTRIDLTTTARAAAAHQGPVGPVRQRHPVPDAHPPRVRQVRLLAEHGAGARGGFSAVDTEA